MWTVTSHRFICIWEWLNVLFFVVRLAVFHINLRLYFDKRCMSLILSFQIPEKKERKKIVLNKYGDGCSEQLNLHMHGATPNWPDGCPELQKCRGIWLNCPYLLNKNNLVSKQRYFKYSISIFVIYDGSCTKFINFATLLYSVQYTRFNCSKSLETIQHLCGVAKSPIPAVDIERPRCFNSGNLGYSGI